MQHSDDATNRTAYEDGISRVSSWLHLLTTKMQSRYAKKKQAKADTKKSQAAKDITAKETPKENQTVVPKE